MSSPSGRSVLALSRSPRCRALLAVVLGAASLVVPDSQLAGIAAGQYTLSGKPDGTGTFTVDNNLTVYLNGVELFADTVSTAGPRQPIAFAADIGDTLRFVVRDTNGRCGGMGSVYLVDAQGRSTIATPGFHDSCDFPFNVDKGVVFETTFAIPDIAATGSSYIETPLPGSAFAGVTRIGGSLYGVTYDGGTNDQGTIFRASPDLSTVTTLYSFGPRGTPGVPYAELIPGGRGFFGVTHESTNIGGAIFEFDISTNTVHYLVDLPYSPYSGLDSALLLLGDYLYGSTGRYPGGSSIFRIKTDGSGFELIHEFSGEDGYHPGALTLGPDGYFYGTAMFGGNLSCPGSSFGCGTVFRLKPDGSEFSVLYTFNRATFADRHPQRAIVFGSDGWLYGTTFSGAFKLSPNPVAPDFQIIRQLVGSGQIFAPPIEGADGRLYIAQYDGGIDGLGSVYSMTKSGGNVVMHHQFARNGRAFLPYGQLYRDSAGTIYGTTEYSDATPDHGRVFAIRTGGANQPPIANATAPASVTAAANCQADVPLNGTGSSDPDGGALTYTWSESGVQIATGPTPTVSLGIGVHTIRLTVTDPSNATDIAEVTVTVANRIAVSYVGPNVLQAEGSNVVRASVTDENGPIAGAAIVFTVNGTPFPATSDAAGIASVDVGAIAGSTAVIQIDYPAAACGGATVTLTKSVNRWPTVAPSAPSPVFADANCTASVPLASNAADPDGHPLTYLWAEGGTTLSTQPNPTVLLAPGQHTIGLTVSDGNGGTRTGSVTVDVRREIAALNYTGPSQFTVNTPTQVSATLFNSVPAPLAGAKVVFTLTGVSVEGTVDAAGAATATITPTNNGIQTLSVSYAGDGCHEPVTFNTSVTVARQTATVIVRKIVVNDDGGQLQAPAFSITVSSPADAQTIPGNAAGTPVTVNVGAYQVAEALNADYEATYSAECSGTTAAGDTRTCTITNDDRPATLTLNKSVTNNNGGAFPPAAWTLRANGQVFVQGTATEVPPGDFVLSEEGPAGYGASPWTCNAPLNGSTVTVPRHRAVSCTIVNDDLPGRLTVVVQIVTNSGGAPALPSDVTVTVTGGAPTPGSFPGSAAGTAVTLNATGYSVTTSPLAGYVATPSVGCAGTMALDGSATCTIVFDDSPQLTADLAIQLIDTPDPVTVGQPLTYTVRVFNNGPDAVPNPTVTVTLPSGVTYSGAAPCTGTTTLTCLPGPVAAFSERPFAIPVVPQVAGQISATAFVPDLGSANDPDNTAVASTRVAKAPTTTALSSTPAASTFGGTVTLTAAVTGFGATGSVTFSSDLGTIGTRPLVNGVAAIDVALATGQRTLTASYSGDTNNEQSTSAPVQHVVSRVTSTTSLTSSPNPSVAGQLVTFTATVTGATPGGTVTFTINGVDQAPATVSSNGIAVLSTAALAAGTANVTARYSGDTNNTPSTSAPVSQQVGVTASTVTLSAAPNPAAPNTFVTLTATVTGFIPTGVVTFLEGNAVLGSGTVTGGTATLVIPQSKKGSRQLSASYGGDSNNLASTSPRIRLTTK